MKPFKKASELTNGDWFIDPCRAGRRPAKVIEVLGVVPLRSGEVESNTERLMFTLDDNVPAGPWSASYEPDTELEMVQPD